ncbi:hypothetical protein [Bacillus sp. FSL K6-3431]|uniref:hypothetical protein n=1 Tax=Bacillus sp. FSL K6-3431 TaxID=2921500 RepID=UPI0030F97435
MDIQSVMKTMLSNQEAKLSGQLNFKTGQIFFGTIQKLFPNQHAEIKIGLHKMIAKLEVPLISGKGYWLQVDSSAGETRLKLLSTLAETSSKGGDSTDLLKLLSLPMNKSNLMLAELLKNEQIPLSKGEINSVGQFLTQADDILLALNTIKLMKDTNMPINEDVFKSLMATGKEPSTQKLLQLLHTALVSESKISSTGKEMLALLNDWKEEDSIKNGRQLFHEILQVAGGKSEQSQKNIMQSILHKLDIKSGVVSQQAIDLAVQKLGNYSNPSLLSSSSNVQISNVIQALTTNEQDVLRQLAIQSERQYSGEFALKQLTQSMQRLGLFYESEILLDDSSRSQTVESLKPLLVKYIQESHTVNSRSRDNAEQLLMRFNGQQLLSIENGPVQQILYEIPLKLGKYETEMTLQWEGNRTAEGQIDPNFCRILFYLELENLNETVVEMQVQNRVVTLNIINDSNKLKPLADTLLPTLKAGLEQMDYILSAVHFKQPKVNELDPIRKTYGRNYDSYTGVDIRI